MVPVDPPPDPVVPACAAPASSRAGAAVGDAAAQQGERQQTEGSSLQGQGKPPLRVHGQAPAHAPPGVSASRATSAMQIESHAVQQQ